MTKKRNERLTNLILDINNSSHNGVKQEAMEIAFELNPHPFLLTDLSGWIGAFIVRAILYKLGIDENYLFRWRPENKYIQYLILNYYAPWCMPATYSLTVILTSDNWVKRLRVLIKRGFFIKATLGFNSGPTNNFDKTADFEMILREFKEEDLFVNEKWILQKKCRLKKEFRIHSFGREVIYGLSFRIGGENEKDVFDRPQEFVKGLLKQLPGSFVEGTLIGWDIGLTTKNKLYVIEANFTGFHPVHRAGFQTTGYVDMPPFGSLMCAFLYGYFRYKYGVSITSIESILIEKFIFLEEFSFYISVIQNIHIQSLFQSKGRVDSAYVYLDEKTESLIIKLFNYIYLANFADNFYIVTSQIFMVEAEKLFKGDRVIYMNEDSLFTRQAYKAVKELSEEDKRRMCRAQIAELDAEKSYILF